MLIRAVSVLAFSMATLAFVGCSHQPDVRSGALRDPKDDDEGGDVVVSLAECPANVQATIKEHTAGASIMAIERTTDHGDVIFEVEAEGDHGIFELNVAEDGAFLGAEDDDGDGDEVDDDDDVEDSDGDVQVTLADCPPAVQATIKQHLGGGVIVEIERYPNGPFEVEVNGPNGEYNLMIAGDGTYLGVENDDEDEHDDDK